MRKSKNIIQRILDERPWSSSSEYFIPTHVFVWILIVLFALWLDSTGGSNDEIHYIDPIHNDVTERMS